MNLWQKGMSSFVSESGQDENGSLRKMKKWMGELFLEGGMNGLGSMEDFAAANGKKNVGV